MRIAPRLLSELSEDDQLEILRLTLKRYRYGEIAQLFSTTRAVVRDIVLTARMNHYAGTCMWSRELLKRDHLRRFRELLNLEKRVCG